MSLIVIKIGTSVLRGDKKYSSREIIKKYCSIITTSKKKGDKIIIVSSGAVGLGCMKLSINKRPVDIKTLQAAAAVGQGYLMSLYEEFFEALGYNVAQILLTRSDFSSKLCYRNASNTIKRLLELDVIPIVNENDTIADDELKYGDNDTLSALVSTAVQADKLILLTDIDKLYSSDPKSDTSAIPISEVHNTKEYLNNNSSNTSRNWGTGGINTKLIAARIATENGIEVNLSDGRNPTNLVEILKGIHRGTIFYPQSNPIGSHKSWLAHALHPLGSIHIDSGASLAITNNGASLLLVGIKSLEGNFNSNQPVRIINLEGLEIARGISSLSSEKILNLLSDQSQFSKSPIVIHRDVLVLLNSHP